MTRNNEPLFNRALVQVMNEIYQMTTLSRAALFNRDPLGCRDIFKEAGYPKVLLSADYERMIAREGLAARINNIYPDESWKLLPTIESSADGVDDDAFEKDFVALDKRVRVFRNFLTADRLSGWGRYGLLFYGYNDGLDPSEPVPGYNAVTDTFRKPTTEEAGGKPFDLLYLIPLAEHNAWIMEREQNMGSRRFGLPTVYQLNFDAATTTDGINPNYSTKLVHWTRVQHILNENNDTGSQVFSVPRLQQIYNRLVDIQKIMAADGEGFYQGGFAGLSVQTQPAGDFLPPIDPEDEKKIKDNIQDYMNKLKRYIFTSGLDVKPLSTNPADPTSHFETQLRYISIVTGAPMRILMGSEEGKLASTQDSRSWNTRLDGRRRLHNNEVFIEPFVNRHIDVGILTRPSGGVWSPKWPDLNTLTDADRAAVAMKLTDAIVGFIAGGGDALMQPYDFLTIVLGMDTDTALYVIENAVKKTGNSARVRKAMQKIRQILMSKGGDKNATGQKNVGGGTGRTAGQGKKA